MGPKQLRGSDPWDETFVQHSLGIQDFLWACGWTRAIKGQFKYYVITLGGKGGGSPNDYI